jgi:CMP-N-acetylneuraminic acid synthetase
MNNLIITICARGGSKGIPNKNMRSINEYPLIAYTINIAFRFSKLHSGFVALATDNEEIKAIAARFGLTTEYIRPPELSTDTAGKIDTIRDLVLFEEKRQNIRFDYILDLDVTSPLRTVKDLNDAYTFFREDPDALNIFSVSKPHRNPYFNIVEKGENGYYRLVKTPEVPVKSRQTAPRVYDLNASFYFYRREFFDLNYKNAYTERSLIWMIDHFCFDLDEIIDFHFMEYLLINNKLDFDFSESCSGAE